MAKKWFPGHYVMMKADVSPLTATGADAKPWDVLSGSDAALFKGGKQYVTWSLCEPTTQGVYDWAHVDDLLDALPSGKKMIIGLATQSWNETLTPVPCPAYMVGNATYDGGYRIADGTPGSTIHVAATMDRWLEMVAAFAARYDSDERLAAVTTMEIPYKAGWRTGSFWSNAALRTEYLKMAGTFPRLFSQTPALSTGVWWTPGDSESLAQFVDLFVRNGGGIGSPDALAEDHARWNSDMRPHFLANSGLCPVSMGMEYKDYRVDPTLPDDAYGGLPFPQAQLDGARLCGASYMYWYTGNRSNALPIQPDGTGGYDFDNHVLPTLRANPTAGLITAIPQNIRPTGGTMHALAPNEVYLTSFPNIYPNSPTMQDSTAGINAAIISARAAKQTIIVPKNTVYYITDTIKCRDPYDATAPNNHYGHNSVKLIGEMGGTRPKFIIHPTAGDWATTVYSNRGKPMVHFYRNASAVYPPATETNKTVHYFATFGNIDLDTNGRPGAWGLAFQGHQHCEIFDTTITATGSLGGIAGGAQTGSPNRNITIIGGATQWLTRGLFTDESAVGLVISHLTLINNEGVGLDLRGSQRASTTVFGLIVSCASGTPIRTAAAGSTSGEMQTGNVSIIDGHIKFTATAGTAIDNANNRSISLRQIYFENCSQIVNSGLAGGDLAGTSGAIHFIDRWHWGNSAQTAGAIVSMIDNGSAILKNAMVAQASGSNGVVGSVPDTVNRWHVETPNWWADDVVWLTDSFQGQPGITPQYPDDVMVDNRAAIQARMDACAAAGRPLFIPGGVGHATDIKSAGGYGIGGTLNLPANLKLIFAVGGQSWFQSTAAWRTAQTTAATVSRMLDTPADADATYQMWWPVFDCGTAQNQYIEAYRSRGGKAVVVNNHKIDREASRHCSTPKTMVRIEGATAGGRWWSCTDHARSKYTGTGTNTYHANYRHILVSGTREPLALIGLVVETRPNSAPIPGTNPVQYYPVVIASPAGPLAVFDDCQNVIIGGYKQEEDGMTTGLTRVLNCQNFLLSIAHGWLGDDKLMMVEGTTQIEMDQLCHQGGLSSVPIVDLVGYAGTIQEANRTEYIGYLRIGSAVNMSVFPTDWLPTPVVPAVIRPVAATVTAVHVVMWAESSSATAALRAVEIMSGGVNIATVSGNVSHEGLTNAAYLVDGNGGTDATFTDIGRFSYDMSGAPASVETVVLKSSNTLAPPIRAEVWIEVSGITQKLKIADADMTQIAPNSPVIIDVLSQTLWLSWHVAAAAKAAAA